MSIRGASAGESLKVERKINSINNEIEELLGSTEMTKTVFKKLSNAKSGGDIATTLRNIRGQTNEDALEKFVELYTELEYLKAIEDNHQHRPEKVKKDLLKLKFVLNEYNGGFSSSKIRPPFMDKVNRKIQEFS